MSRQSCEYAELESEFEGQSVSYSNNTARFANEFFSTHLHCSPGDVFETKDDFTNQLTLIHELTHFLQFAATPYGWDRWFRISNRIYTLATFVKEWKATWPKRRLPVPLLTASNVLDSRDPALPLLLRYRKSWADDYVLRHLEDGDYSVGSDNNIRIRPERDFIVIPESQWHLPVAWLRDASAPLSEARFYNCGARAIMENSAHITTHMANREYYEYRSKFALYESEDPRYYGLSDHLIPRLRGCYDSFLALADLALFGPCEYLGSIKELYGRWGVEDQVPGHRFLRAAEVADSVPTISELGEKGLGPAEAWQRFVESVCGQLGWPTPRQVVEHAAGSLCPMLLEGKGYGLGAFIPAIIARTILLRRDHPYLLAHALFALTLHDRIDLPVIAFDGTDYVLVNKAYRDVGDDHQQFSKYAWLSSQLIYGGAGLDSGRLSCSFHPMRLVRCCEVAPDYHCDGTFNLVSGNAQKCYLTQSLLTLGLRPEDLEILQASFHGENPNGRPERTAAY